ncbi:Ppx/GppA phosphatase family protein [Methanoregula sp.]|uniref:Ppx/GppA phosphatase family protein n=1 Tax=Methanoregula sp. TaxID=2052170 RepID=UPI0025CC6021|nr:Ppx/GppA phosphatase family protein [Methanoregula sp.]
MKSRKIGAAGRIVAFIDIGTNSVRMLVVRFNPNHSYSILTRQKQQVRLGEGEFDDEEITPEAIDRTCLVCRKFVDLARTFSAEEFVAVATSAAREASNQNELLNRLRRDALLDVRVISGLEEARLIYLGVASGMHLGDQQAFFLDIGGGSTEISVGGQQQYQILESFRLGAIRLTNLFFSRNLAEPVRSDQYKVVQQYVKNAIIHTVQKIKKQKIDLAVGSSGSIMNLADIAQKALHPAGTSPSGVLTYRDLKKVIDLLCALPLEDRRKVPGVNPERADIIIAGAVILEIFMKELALESVTTTSRGLQDGLLVDYLSRMEDFPLFGTLSPRETSVLQLGRSCGINEAHARTVTRLALEIFDSAKEMKLHDYGEWEQELLEYAAFLHDIGSFISFTNHHAHSYYIIKNSELLGFDLKEIDIMANIARFHRKKKPRKKHLDVPDLDGHEQRMVLVLAMFVRLGESLDRSHAGLVEHTKFIRSDKNEVVLDIIAQSDCQLEIWGVEAEQRAFEKVFSKRLIINVIASRTDGNGNEKREN